MATAIEEPKLHWPPPEGVDSRSSATGLRAVATFEAIKGVAALLIAAGMLALLHKDVEDIAERVLTHLHISLDRHVSVAILHAASRVTTGGLWAIAGAAVVYASVRFTEAWGLWHRRVWAEWFALLSGTLYLPWEIVKMVQKPNWLHGVIIAGNAALVLYMLYVRVSACRPAESE